MVIALVSVGVLFFLLQVAIVRWIFRINPIVNSLESIAHSLQQLPAVRAATSASTPARSRP